MQWKIISGPISPADKKALRRRVQATGICL